MAKKKYDDEIKLRATKETKILLKKKSQAAALSQSEYVRQLIHKEVVKENKNILFALNQLTSEVNHIGVNINQIVKNNNSNFYIEHEKKKLISCMNDIHNKFAEILEIIMENTI